MAACGNKLFVVAACPCPISYPRTSARRVLQMLTTFDQ
jgi:hypothetical protein